MERLTKPGISLRDVAARLNPGSNKRDYSKLLSLLKAGQIKAGFRFPAFGSLWIEIRTAYWSGVDSAEFRTSLRFDKGRPSSGAFSVSLAVFAEQICDVLAQRSEPANWKHMAELLAATGKRYEVEILEEEWARFLEVNPSYLPAPRQKSRRGRYELESWRDLCIYIGAYIIKHHQKKTSPRIKLVEASETIHKITENEGIRGAASTIERALSEIVAKAEVISID
ncbi:MAG: hypothetical protein WBD95_27035 [Xanthobacteraceae bacterium]